MIISETSYARVISRQGPTRELLDSGVEPLKGKSIGEVLRDLERSVHGQILTGAIFNGEDAYVLGLDADRRLTVDETPVSAIGVIRRLERYFATPVRQARLLIPVL